MNSNFDLNISSLDLQRINASIQKQIDEMKSQPQNPFNKPVLIYTHVQHDSNLNWISYFHKTLQSHYDDHIALIPYHTKQSDLIGIVMDIDSNGYIGHPGFIDRLFSLMNGQSSNQTALTVSYPQDLAFFRFNLKEQATSDPIKLVIDLLLLSRDRGLTRNVGLLKEVSVASEQGERIQQDDLTTFDGLTRHTLQDNSYYMSSDYSHKKISEDDDGEQVILEANISSLSQEHNFKGDEMATLKLQKEKLMGELEVGNEDYLKDLIREKEEQLTLAEKRGQQKTATTLRNTLESLRELQSIFDRQRVLEDTLADAEKRGDLTTLRLRKEELMSEFEVENENDLNDLIREKEEQLTLAEKRGQQKTATTLRNTLDSLRELESIFDKQRVVEATLADANRQEDLTVLEGKSQETIDERTVLEIFDEEILPRLFEYFNALPICSDRYILRLIFLTSLKSAPSKVLDGIRIQLPVDFHDEITTLLQELEERLKVEEVHSRIIEESLTICNMHNKANSWDLLTIELKKLWKVISPIDIHELKRLVGKVDEAANKVRGKDIILLIGPTGAGKSTTIHFIGGSTMRKIVQYGMIHIAPTEIRNDELRSVATAPSAVSITRYIHPITIRLKDIGGDHDKYVIVCDCPGFEDTSGPEVDIANGIGILRAVRGCHSVKPLVLISYKSIGDRSTGIKDLAHILVGMIRSISDHLSCFEYYFTKFPEDEMKTIHATLSDVMRHLKDDEKHDASFVRILEDMIDKTEEEPKVLDPINGNPLKLIKSIMRSSYIKYPSEVFQFSLSEKSRSIVKQQVRQHQLNIISAMKRFDYLYIMHKLDQLKYLSDLLEQDDLRQIYETVVNEICEHLTQQYTLATTYLQKCLINQNTLTKEDISHYQRFMKRATDADDLRNRYLREEVITSDSYQHYLLELVVSLSKEVQMKKIDDEEIKLILDKLKLVTESFSYVRTIYTETILIFQGKVDVAHESFKISVENRKFEETAADLTKIKAAIRIFNGHIDNLEQIYENQKQYFVGHLTEYVETFKNTFQKSLEKSDIEKLTRCIEVLESAEQTLILHIHISRESIHRIHEILSAQIVTHFNTIVSQIDESIKKNKDFGALEKLLYQLDDMRSIPSIEYKTNKNYLSTLEELIGHVNKCRINCENSLKSFLSDESVDFEVLCNSLLILQDAKWIEKYRKDVYSDIISAIQRQIMISLESNESIVTHTIFGLDNIENLKIVSKIIQHNNEIGKLHKFFPDIQKKVKSLNDQFTKMNNECFAILKTNFNTKKLEAEKHHIIDVNKLESGLEYLEICQKIHVLNETSCRSTLDELQQFIRTYNMVIKNEMDENFERIKNNKNDSSENLAKYVRMFADRLKEYFEIEAHRKQVFSLFTERTLLQDWKTAIVNFRKELEEGMKLCSRNSELEDLKVKLSIAKMLCRIDWFITDSKFNDLYEKYQSIFFAGTDEVSKRAMEALTKHDYSQVSSDMILLKQSDKSGEFSFNQVSRAIDIGISSLKEETSNLAIMIGRDVKKEDIAIIIDNLNKLQNAKQFISDYIKNSNSIQECIDEVKAELEKKVTAFIGRVRTTLELNNFSLFDQKIESVDLIHNLLKKYRTPEIVKQVDDLKDYQTTFIKDEVVNKYSQMSVDKYMIDPPMHIFAKLAEVRDINSIYDQAFKSIKDAIFTNLRNTLEAAKNHKPPSTENEHIRRVELAMKYLPEEMKIMVEHELQLCKESITTMINDIDKRIKDLSEGEDISEVMNALKEYQSKSDMKFYLNRFKEKIISRIRETSSKLDSAIEKNNIPDMLEHWKLICEYHSELSKVRIDTMNIYFKIKKRVTDAFEETMTPIIKFVETIQSKIDETERSIVEQKLQSLLEFMRFFARHKDLEFINELLPNNYNYKIEDLDKKIIDFMKNLDFSYEEAFLSFDAELLKNAFERTRKYSYFISIIKNSSVPRTNCNTVNDLTMIGNKFTYTNDVLDFMENKLKEIQTELKELKWINLEKEETSKEVEVFCRDLSKKFFFMKRANDLQHFGLKFDSNKAEHECINIFQQEVVKVHKNAQEHLIKYLQEGNSQLKTSDQFNLRYHNLKLFFEAANFMEFDTMSSLKAFDVMIDETITFWSSAFEQGDIASKAAVLIRIKSASIDIFSFRTKFHDAVDHLLDMLKNSTSQSSYFNKLAVFLYQDKRGLGRRIVAEHKAYRRYSLVMLNMKLRRHGIEYVLDNLRGNGCDASKLRARYDTFLETYEGLLNTHLQTKIDLKPLISNTHLLSANIVYQNHKINWNASIRDSVLKLVANVFAIWTLQNWYPYFESFDNENIDLHLLKPHAGQVISIFRMLGIGDSKEELENNLVQIGTGEGKSVTLAVTATILAFMGFEVYCACYSEYLSDRDHKAFESLFDALSVKSSIHFGTFNKLCEYVINEDGDIRQVVQQLITKNFNKMKENNGKRRPKILLIDEVDVFFNSDFYGNLYTPATCLKDKSISALINYIWSNRKTMLTLNKVKQTTEYRQCCAQFPRWEELIQEAIKDMLTDVENFESHSYVVKNDKIGYIEHDNITFNVSYGYKTLFAYFFEYQQKRISLKSLEEKQCILIKCGGYSYAEIPLKFTHIMGVTGTLETVSEPERDIIENVYGIKKQTIIPSVFGKNNLHFIMKNDIKIENVHDYFNRIAIEIDERLSGRTDNRAVLVFFESEAKLKEFYESDVLRSRKDSINILTEEMKPEKKESLIKRATVSGEITLLTKIFGRGTDFICYDPSVVSNGGIHVIQVFLSEDASEEVQIKGRTARQGDQGSYSMILLDKDLEKFGIYSHHIDDIKNGKPVAKHFWKKTTDKLELGEADKYQSIYELLHDARIDFFKTQYAASRNFVEAAKVRHHKSIKFLESLKSGDPSIIRSFLIEENKGVELVKRSKTICLMDATGSMSHLLQKSKNTVGLMIERTSTILIENGISSDSFEIQFVVYRNYCCEEMNILQHSTWETKSDNLRAFMNGINVQGGLGNEAIEIGLQHANRENRRENISQIILIGDAPPNTEEEVVKKRAIKGEKYWEKTKFKELTDYKKELAILKNSGIKVHAFFVHTKAQKSFEEIARATSGTCEFLDINSDSGSLRLTDLVTQEILRNIGGSTKGDVLVEAYRRKFARSYE